MRTHDNEPFVLRRDVKAVMVPAGIEIELKSGQSGFITQALGGSFTLYMEGNLFRLAGADADAIGKEVVKTPEAPAELHRRRCRWRWPGTSCAPAMTRRSRSTSWTLGLFTSAR